MHSSTGPRPRPSKSTTGQSGFTLIELLVVILIIGILAAIAIPAFLGQRNKGQDASAKSNARNLVSQMETCFTDQQNYSSCTDNTNIVGSNLPIESAFPPSQQSVAARGTSNTFTIVANSLSGNYFSITKSSGGTIDRVCSTSGTGSCLTSGTW